MPSPVAMAGFVLIGVGAANVVPVLFRGAGSQAVMPPVLAIAAITTMGYAGILLGPALIGFVADHVGLTLAFWMIPVLVLSVRKPMSASCTRTSGSVGALAEGLDCAHAPPSAPNSDSEARPRAAGCRRMRSACAMRERARGARRLATCWWACFFFTGISLGTVVVVITARAGWETLAGTAERGVGGATACARTAIAGLDGDETAHAG